MTEATYPGMQSEVGLRKHHCEQASGNDGMQVELFQILKDDALIVPHSICPNLKMGTAVIHCDPFMSIRRSSLL